MKKLPNTLDKVSIFILLDYQNYGLTIMEVAEEINRRIINGSVPAETLVIASEQQSDLANGAVAEEDIKLVFGFAKNIAKVFDRERSSNVWFWIQQAMPDKADRWEDVQELLDKILRATASL